ncbi:hypothetical protein B0T16DRAFT_384025 [Cercophora newfieldiana]|uniref:Uncharacterized protein n=1 Tax=Cercophora newfieldiana TaxID=92897 RepID=A0AA39YMC1_9PEZI|nr:hypothetical protein B0T16DRAFT_384025 [Cercophora newfieldiana]
MPPAALLGAPTTGTITPETLTVRWCANDRLALGTLTGTPFPNLAAIKVGNVPAGCSASSFRCEMITYSVPDDDSPGEEVDAACLDGVEPTAFIRNTEDPRWPVKIEWGNFRILVKGRYFVLVTVYAATNSEQTEWKCASLNSEIFVVRDAAGDGITFSYLKHVTLLTLAQARLSPCSGFAQAGSPLPSRQQRSLPHRFISSRKGPGISPIILTVFPLTCKMSVSSEVPTLRTATPDLFEISWCEPLKMQDGASAGAPFPTCPAVKFRESALPPGCRHFRCQITVVKPNGEYLDVEHTAGYKPTTKWAHQDEGDGWLKIEWRDFRIMVAGVYYLRVRVYAAENHEQTEWWYGDVESGEFLIRD